MNINASIIPPEGTLFGSDPEYMLKDHSTGEIVSAIDVLNNDKHSPIELGDGILMYADNVMVEFSFPPVPTAEAMVTKLRLVMALAMRYFNDTFDGRYSLLAKAAHGYSEESLMDPRAKEAGCSPNFCVWTQSMNDKPPMASTNIRTGSFHIHVGSKQLRTKEAKDRMIRLMDCLVGFPSIILDMDDTSHDRRMLYGQAGEFRPTDYGIEYRVLGPYALRHPSLVARTIEATTMALNNLNTVEENEYSTLGIDNETIRRAINEHNAHDVMEYRPACEDKIPYISASDMYGFWGF